MAKDKKPVLTPGGMRPESVVHHVQPGQMVKRPKMVVTSSDEPAGVRLASTAQDVASSPMAPVSGMTGESGDEPGGNASAAPYFSCCHSIDRFDQQRWAP